MIDFIARPLDSLSTFVEAWCITVAITVWAFGKFPLFYRLTVAEITLKKLQAQRDALLQQLAPA